MSKKHIGVANHSVCKPEMKMIGHKVSRRPLMKEDPEISSIVPPMRLLNINISTLICINVY